MGWPFGLRSRLPRRQAGSAGGFFRVRLDWDPLGIAGWIKLWTTSVPDQFRNNSPIENGGDQVVTGSEYALSDLNYNPLNGIIVVYAEGWSENVNIKTLAGVEQFGKPDERVRATVVVGGVDRGSDEVKYIVANEDSFFYHLQTRQEVRNGLASRGVYTRDDMPEFSLMPLDGPRLADLGIDGAMADIRDLLGPEGGGVAGFNAMLYQDFITGPNQYVLAFAGTEMSSKADWINNIKQGLGYPAAQYNAAMQIADALVELQNIFSTGTLAASGNLIATGHSLGGGLASAASVAGGIPAHTFNAAGLHASTLNEQLYSGSTARYDIEADENTAGIYIKAYYVDWDILSLVQDHYAVGPIDPPSAIGQRIEMDGPYDTELTIIQVLGLPLVSVYFTINAHLNPAVLHGLLVDEGVWDVLGYDL